jgi:hypothetical protein
VRPRVAILLHPPRRRAERIDYRIWALQRAWEAGGIEVTRVWGPPAHVDADVLISHIDLTLVPAKYHAILDSHPCVVNRAVRDVSKRRISRNLVRPGDGWDGPVIVKTDRNHGGLPESRRRLLRRRDGMDPLRYPVYRAAAEVPAGAFRDPRLVVERFLPELEGGRYHTRVYSFFGDRHVCTRRASPHPIVKIPQGELVGPCPVPDEIVAERRRLGFDSGKFDFVLHDGVPVLLDANPTPALPPGMEALAEELAAGLDAIASAAPGRARRAPGPAAPA